MYPFTIPKGSSRTSRFRAGVGVQRLRKQTWWRGQASLAAGLQDLSWAWETAKIMKDRIWREFEKEKGNRPVKGEGACWYDCRGQINTGQLAGVSLISAGED